ncbi:hypothetical protein Sta7437_4846 (plasmid) [Stanieria cyanosphaera PCC 7437]|uniref:Uncharacterized protein n=1 Tax=Stanieria cyanosphaera (strain ATCC 29371 / PCC 7437) TaxID=111780 RepID=K9Y1S2_STAC7|nr:hypothetical protein Sta7437_4846 [Stanieria cyanosphaera PCC 7437]
MLKIALVLIFSWLLFSYLISTSFAQSAIFASNNNFQKSLINRQTSYQENTISLSKQELQQPLYLKIKTSDTTILSGKISFKKRTIVPLKNNLNLDLSTLLLPGKNEIELIGNYTPINNSISIEIQGKTTSISTSTAGSGILQQKLIIDVY